MVGYDSMDVSLSKLQDRGAWHAVVYGVAKSWTTTQNEYLSYSRKCTKHLKALSHLILIITYKIVILIPILWMGKQRLNYMKYLVQDSSATERIIFSLSSRGLVAGHRRQQRSPSEMQQVAFQLWGLGLSSRTSSLEGLLKTVLLS